jgi:hypothetical protein
MAKKKQYTPSQVITAAAGYSAGKAVAKATDKVTTAARKTGKAIGKRLKKAAGGRRRGPQDAVMPKLTARYKAAAKKKADEKKAGGNASGIKKAVKGMYPFNVARGAKKLAGK